MYSVFRRVKFPGFSGDLKVKRKTKMAGKYIENTSWAERDDKGANTMDTHFAKLSMAKKNFSLMARRKERMLVSHTDKEINHNTTQY